MNDEQELVGALPLQLSRRSAVALLGAGAGALLGGFPLLPAQATLRRIGGSVGVGAAVVSIHMDLPYVDVSGTELPYIPGSHAGRYEQLASMDETEAARWLYNC